MADKVFNTRLINKHDIETNWLKATGFIPKQGEIIIYDVDDNYTYERFKIGDGVSNINDLPFTIEKVISEIPRPDWNQSNPNANDYVENRTHYKKPIKVELFPEQSLAFANGSSADGHICYYNMLPMNNLGLVDGATYVVVIDDTEYEGVARTENYAIRIGNMNIMSSSYEDTGECFLVNDKNPCSIFTNLLGETHTIAIYKLEWEYVPIDIRYLPESVRIYDENVELFKQIRPENAAMVTYLTISDSFVNSYLDTNVPQKLILELDTGTFELKYAGYVPSVSKHKWQCNGGQPSIEWEETNSCYGIRFSTSYSGYSGRLILLSHPITHQLNEKYIPNTIARVSDLAAAIELDTTLAVEGAAADAKAVGDALAGKQPVGNYALKNELSASTADWNQNDPNANNYVKNRTHWVEGDGSQVTLLQDHSFTGGLGSQLPSGIYINYYNLSTPLADYYYTDADNLVWPVKEGDICHITILDATYTCTVTYNDGMMVAGNTTILESVVDQTAEPFLFAFADSTGGDQNLYVALYTTYPTATPPITIVREIPEVIHKLDSKFIELNIVNGTASGSLRQVSSAVENDNYTLGQNAVAFGAATQASGDDSFAQGNSAVASGDGSHAEGQGAEASGTSAHAEGSNTVASGGSSHAEGENSQATAWATHAEGGSAQATMNYAHAEGLESIASGYGSHAEGHNSQASGQYSHAEGDHAIASDDAAHAEGYYTEAKGNYSHAEGKYTIAASENQHVQGKFNIEDTESTYAHIVGNGSGQGDTPRSNAHTLDWDGNAWYAGNVYIGADNNKLATESYADLTAQTQVNALNLVGGPSQNLRQVTATPDGTTTLQTGEVYYLGSNAAAFGYSTRAFGPNSFAEGQGATASGQSSHAEGQGTTASGGSSHAEGYGTTASGGNSHAEGENTTASFPNAHAEGYSTTASGENSHAEGQGTTASSFNAHAEGAGTTASGAVSHAEGSGTVASGVGAHAEGQGTQATKDYAHAEGIGAIAQETGAHAEGLSTIAGGLFQHVQGKHNLEVTGNVYAHIVGNGDSPSSRSNAHAVGWDGNAYYSGNVYVLGDGTTVDFNGKKKLATEEEIDTKIAEISASDIGIVAITDAEIDEICGTVLDASEIMTDNVTGKQYALYVSNGDLMMTEVS